MQVRGVRGAIQISENNRRSILDGTAKLLKAMIEENAIPIEDIASIIFTVTDDLIAEFPAAAARQIGLVQVPLMCAVEMAVPDALKRVIRILIHFNTEKSQADIIHCYLDGAEKLRPDLTPLKR